jgi:hypothetical protein
MPLTNFPFGVTSFGVPVVPGPFLNYWGGGKVFWVCNRSGVTPGDGSGPDRPLASLFTATTGAIAKIGSTQGSLIIVLPGHVESITASTNMSTLAGSGSTFLNIVGIGNGALRPTLNWTATASALLCNLAGLTFRNFVFNLNATAATVVTAAITHSAADQVMDTVDFLPNTSATQLTTTAITVASGADNLTYNGVRAFGETFATNPTDFFTTTAAVNKLTMLNCKFMVALNATTNGAINLANAPTNVYIEDCTFMNKKAASTVAGIASASTTGTIAFSTFIVIAAGAPSTAMNTPGNLLLSQCFGGQITKAGAIQGTVAT